MPAKKKPVLLSLLLSAGLLLSACSSDSSEDPQDVLKGNDPATVTSGGEVEAGEQIPQEELEALHNSRTDEDYLREQEEAQKVLDALEDPSLPPGGEVDTHSTTFGQDVDFVYYGIDMESIEVPENIQDLFSDFDTSRAAPAALEALEWADRNTGAQLNPLGETEVHSWTDYMSHFLSDVGEERFRGALTGELSQQEAWILMPHYNDLNFEGKSVEIDTNGIWQTGVNAVQVQDETVYNKTGESIGGILVTMNRAIYVPILDGEELVLAHSLALTMVPGTESGDNDWVIEDWSYTVGSGSKIQARSPLQ